MSGHPLLRADAPPVLIVSGCHGATQRYRCFHHDEQLRWRGIPSRVIMQWSPHLLDAALGCGTVVLHRVAMDRAVAALITRTRDGGGVVLFDIDDLVFEPEATRWHRGVTHLPPAEQALYHDGVRRYRETLLASDGAIVPTSYLASRVTALGQPAWVSRNCVDVEILRLSEQATAGRKASRPGRVVVGYASGSRTHDEDFGEAAAPALRRVMNRHPSVEFQIVGPLALGPEWAPLADRIQHLPGVDWRDLPALIAGFDISLAPLELENPFCRAKSELKWLEAAACRVATVASATAAFAAAVDDGRTGLVVGDAAEWEAALDRLVDDAALRAALAAAAHAEVHSRRTTAAQAAGYEATLQTARQHAYPRCFPPAPREQPQPSSRTPLLPPGTRGQPQPAPATPPPATMRSQPQPRYPPPAVPGEPGTGLRVNFLLPEPVRGSGGHTSIVRLAGGLAERGHEVTVHVDPGPLFQAATDEELALFFERHFPAARVRFRLGRDFAPADVLIATGWTTASAAAFATNARQRLYFVQDFEPYFQPMGAGYAAAESTYRLGLGHITLGPWLAELLNSRYGARAVPIDFGVEHEIYYPAETARRRQVVFYGRGATPRRGTALGLAALRQVKAARPDVDVILYGDPFQGLDADGFRHVGVLTRQQLADLYRESVAGLALSYTNLSFVPLEMMACGCAVVAVDAPAVRWFQKDGDNAVVAESTAESLAGGMLRLLDDDALREQLVAGGRSAVADYSWDRSAEQFEAHVRSYAGTGTGRETDPSPETGTDPEPGPGPGPGPVTVKSPFWPGLARGAREPVEPVLDVLAGRGEMPLPLAVGRRLDWNLECAVDGLYRVDLRLAVRSPVPRGELVLWLEERASSAAELDAATRAGVVIVPMGAESAPTSAETAPVGAATPPIAAATRAAAEAMDGEWLAFEFPARRQSAGRVFGLALEWRDAGHDGEVVLLTDSAVPVERQAAVGMRADGEAVAAVPAERSFGLSGAPPDCRDVGQLGAPPPQRDCWPSRLPAGGTGIGQIQRLQRQLTERRRVLAELRAGRAAIARGRGYELIRRWRRSTRPMPPPALRPWPEDSLLAAKLWQGLWTYGPVAVWAELLHYARWRQRQAAGERSLESVAVVTGSAGSPPIPQPLSPKGGKGSRVAAESVTVAERVANPEASPATDRPAPDHGGTIDRAMEAAGRAGRRLRVGMVTHGSSETESALAGLLAEGLVAAGHAVVPLVDLDAPDVVSGRLPDAVSGHPPAAAPIAPAAVAARPPGAAAARPPVVATARPPVAATARPPVAAAARPPAAASTHPSVTLPHPSATALSHSSAGSDKPAPWDVVIAAGARAVPHATQYEAPTRLLLAADDAALHQPMGPDLVAAERAHAMGLDVLALGPWLAAWLRARYGATTVPVKYAVDGTAFHPGPENRGQRLVYDIGRIVAPFESDLGLQSLMRLVDRLRHVEIVLCGPLIDPLPGLDLPFRYQWAGQLDGPTQGDLFRTASAVLVTDFTNLPPHVPEAMACGCAVVAADTGSVRWLLRDGCTAALAPPRADALAEVLLQVLTDEDYRRCIVDQAYLAVQQMDPVRARAGMVAAVEAAAAGSTVEAAAAGSTVEAATAGSTVEAAAAGATDGEHADVAVSGAVGGAPGGEAIDGALGAAPIPALGIAAAFDPAAETAPLPEIGVDPGLDALLNQLAALDQAVHWQWVALEADRRTLPYRLLHLGDWLGRPLPPLDDRPWRPSDPGWAKLAGMLRHYGPLAPVRELGAWLRWQRMTAVERAEARGTAVASPGVSARSRR